jgi:hypothetical protein
VSAIPFPSPRRRWRRGSSDARVLALSAKHFDETGEWPLVEDLQHGLVAWFDLSDAERKVSRLPKWLGRRENDGRVVLSVCGLHCGEPNSRLLEDFEAVLVLAARDYRAMGMQRRAVLSPDALAERLSISKLRAERALTLFVTEGLAAPAGADRVLVTPSIKAYLFVRNVDEYMKVRKQEECRNRRRRVRELPGRVVGWFRSEDTSIGAKVLATILSGVATAALLAALAIAIHGLELSGEDHPSHKPPAPVAHSGE